MSEKTAGSGLLKGESEGRIVPRTGIFLSSSPVVGAIVTSRCNWREASGPGTGRVRRVGSTEARGGRSRPHRAL